VLFAGLLVLGNPLSPVCFALGQLFLKPCFRGELSAQRRDCDAEFRGAACRTRSLGHLVHAAQEVLQRAHLHQQPPHDGVVAVAVADDGELRFG
jgi:hypothetical protein